MKLRSSLSGLCSRSAAVLRFCARHTGLPLVYLGVLLLAVFYIAGLTNHNVLLFVPMALIVLGVVGFVHGQRSVGNY